jgi:hypothetical protein
MTFRYVDLMSAGIDVPPWIRTYASMISALGEKKDEQEQAQRSAEGTLM